MTFVLKIIGSNSAAPAFNRHPTAQLLRIQQEFYLIDCGEGTQMQLSRFKVRFIRINRIFISHLHGDHYLGLMGLISTMHLHGRKEDLYLYGPPGLAEILSLQLKASDTRLNYKVHFFELKPEPALIFENEHVTIETIPLQHRIQCTGFLFKEKTKKRKLKKEALPGNLSVEQIIRLKEGKDLLDAEGKVLYKNTDLTLPPKKSRSYAYCSDTVFSESIVEQISEVDLLYHESTFLDNESERALETFHSTARQAAIIAKKANAKQLLLGHYSSRYRDLEPFLTEARSVFANSYLSIEGDDIMVE